MSLKIKIPVASALASNKPPPEAKSPDPSLFATHFDFPDGKRIWRSYPLPDKIRLNGYLLAGHFQSKAKPKVNLAEEVGILAVGLAGAGEGEDAQLPNKGKLLLRVKLHLGDRLSHVFIEIRNVSKEGVQAFKMHVEFNPRKLGKNGCKQLLGTLEQAANGPFQLHTFLADCRLTRLDVAVDFADLRPADLIVTSKVKEGQRVHYLGEDGALETVQVHRKTKKAKLGTLAAKVYDRNRERKAHGKPPPYPGRQVTRLEITKTRFPQGFGLADLPKLKNPLDGVRLSYADVLGNDDDLKLWRAYLALRMGVGHAEAISRLPIKPTYGTMLEKRYRNHPSSLLGPDVWGGWGSGLSASGFESFVMLATEGKKPAEA